MSETAEESGARAWREAATLRANQKILVEAAKKAAAHVRPTCFDLYTELQKALAPVKGNEK